MAGRGTWGRAGTDAPICVSSPQSPSAGSFAYTGLVSGGALPAPRGRRHGASGWRANISSMRKLVDPVLERARGGLGPLGPMMQIWVGVAMSVEVGAAGRLSGTAGARPVRARTARRALGDEPAAVAVRASEPRSCGAVDGCRRARVHDLGGAARGDARRPVRGRAVAAGPSRRARRRAARECRGEDRERRRRARLPSGDELARAVGSLRRGDLLSIVASPSERETLDRVQAVMAVIEGHAEHVMDAVAPDLLPSLPRLRRSLDQRRRSQKGLHA